MKRSRRAEEPTRCPSELELTSNHSTSVSAPRSAVHITSKYLARLTQYISTQESKVKALWNEMAKLRVLQFMYIMAEIQQIKFL